MCSVQPLREAHGPERRFVLRALSDEALENKEVVVIPLPENWSARSHSNLLAEVGFDTSYEILTWRFYFLFLVLPRDGSEIFSHSP